MAIMPAHVGCSMIFGFVFQSWVSFNHGERVHICSESNTSFFALLRSIACQIDNESSLSHLFPLFRLHTELNQNLFNSFSGLELLKRSFRISMKFTSQDNQSVKCRLRKHNLRKIYLVIKLKIVQIRMIRNQIIILLECKSEKISDKFHEQILVYIDRNASKNNLWIFLIRSFLLQLLLFSFALLQNLRYVKDDKGECEYS